MVLMFFKSNQGNRAMDNTISITLDQLDAINRSLNKAMAVSRVLANCGPGKRPMTDPPCQATRTIAPLAT